MRHLTGALRPWLMLALVCAVFSAHPVFRATFWSLSYLPNLLQQSGRNIVLAVGMTFVILTGGIDLSVGAVLGLSGVALALAMRGSLPTWLAALPIVPIAAAGAWLTHRALRDCGQRSQWAGSVAVFLLVTGVGGLASARMLANGVVMEGAIAIALLVGISCGLLNGLTVSVGRVPAFVVTLGMMSAARGLTLYATDGASVRADVPRFMVLGQGWPLALVTLAVVAAAVVLLRVTRAGRYVLAIGGNEQASRLSGVSVAGFKTLAYMLSGLTAAVGAVLVTAKFGLADTNAGSGAELEAIAAVVIGGTSLAGGQGSIVGALIGALTITVIEAGLVMVSIRDTLQPVILGTVIVVTVFLDQINRGASRAASVRASAGE